VSKPERRAGIKEYLKARSTCTEIQISAVTAHHKPSRARLSAAAYRGFGLQPRQCSVVKQLQDRLCWSEDNFTHVGH
jgi:hypothetical protein